MIAIVVALLVAACLVVPIAALRYKNGARPDWADFRRRSAVVNSALTAIFAAAVLAEIALAWPLTFTKAFILFLQFPLALLARRFGYQIAFFRDPDNWSRPKR